MATTAECALVPSHTAPRPGAATIRTSHVLMAISAVALLAFALPFTAVRTLHTRRLTAADSQLATRGSTWVLSAGPTGIIETAFLRTGDGTGPAEDDRAGRIH